MRPSVLIQAHLRYLFLYRRAAVIIALATLLISTMFANTVTAEDPSQAQILERLQQLENEQKEMRELLKAKDARLNELEQELQRVKEAATAGAAPGVAQGPPAAPAPASPSGTSEGLPEPEPTPQLAAPVPSAPGAQPTPQLAEAPSKPRPWVSEQFFGRYQPGGGYVISRTELGDLVFSGYAYVRYLNQKGLDKTFTNEGETTEVDRRNDFELNKVKLEFKGWFLDPRFRYVLYTWTNNTAMGLGAQVVVGGNLRWAFSDAFTLGGGIFPLPSVRSNEGMWPYFLGVDHRTLTDEFFRGSYTMGIFAFGQLAPGLQYSTMLGDNLSILGVDANQLDGRFQTVAAALRWMPTTGEFGERGGAFGDYEDHQELATRLGAHFTFSPEDAQQQPNTDAPDNSQIRLSNSTVIFTPGALAPDVTINKVKYYMTSFDAGMKYHGFALEGEYYHRWLNDFHANGELPIDHMNDDGFQVMASAMALPKTLQLYTQGAYLFGEFGDPWEVTAGINWWVFKRRELRLNLEYIYDRRSPVGYSAIPQQVGGTGSIFNGNLELFF
jgi:hypothetical protein